MKGFEPITCRLSANQQPGVRVHSGRPVQELGDSQDVDAFVVCDVGTIGDRDANRLTTQAFCTPLPAEQFAKCLGTNDGSLVIPDGFDSRRLFTNPGTRTPAQAGHNRTQSRQFRTGIGARRLRESP